MRNNLSSLADSQLNLHFLSLFLKMSQFRLILAEISLRNSREWKLKKKSEIWAANEFVFYVQSLCRTFFLFFFFVWAMKWKFLRFNNATINGCLVINAREKEGKTICFKIDFQYCQITPWRFEMFLMIADYFFKILMCVFPQETTKKLSFKLFLSPNLGGEKKIV